MLAVLTGSVDEESDTNRDELSQVWDEEGEEQGLPSHFPQQPEVSPHPLVEWLQCG